MNATEKIFQLMAERGETAAKVAQATGISKGNFTDWKKGRAQPGLVALTKLSEYFGMPIDELAGNSAPLNPNKLFVALNREISGMTDDMLEELLRFAQHINEGGGQGER